MTDDSRHEPAVYPKNGRARLSWLELLTLGLLAVIGFAGLRAVLIGFAVWSASPRSRENMHRLVYAMGQCYETEGGFPAPAIYSKDGEPLLSWRVALLPYLGQGTLYNQFHLDEPWDSEHNRGLLARIPSVYATPVPGKDRAPGLTYYQVLVGKSAAFEHRKRMRVQDFWDGTSNTILIVEAGQPVPWTKPVDVPFDPDKPVPKLGGLFADHFHIAMADGTVRCCSKAISEHTLRMSITRNGGEVFTGDW
jgi:hypothetical protein